MTAIMCFLLPPTLVLYVSIVSAKPVGSIPTIATNNVYDWI